MFPTLNQAQYLILQEGRGAFDDVNTLGKAVRLPSPSRKRLSGRKKKDGGKTDVPPSGPAPPKNKKQITPKLELKG